MWSRSTKQRRSAVRRRWIQAHLDVTADWWAYSRGHLWMYATSTPPVIQFSRPVTPDAFASEASVTLISDLSDADYREIFGTDRPTVETGA